MSLIMECFYYYSNRISILVKVKRITYKIVLVSTVLTDVKTCFVILVGILIIHSPTVFIYINIFLSDPALIKTPAY